MIHEEATVLAVNGKRVEIEVKRQGSCGDCSLTNSCGVGALGRLLGRRDKLSITSSELNLKRGDHILLGIPERGLLKASLLVYGLPLLMLFVAALIANVAISSAESVLAVAAVGGFLGGLRLASVLLSGGFATRLNPQILRVNNEPINRF